MYKHQVQVREFHQKFDLLINHKPLLTPRDVLALRCRLLLEEVLEYIEASGFEVDSESLEVIDIGKEPNLILMADALTDIQYVNDGAAVSLGIDLEPIANEVHRSNMSKLWKLIDLTELRKNNTLGKWDASGNQIHGFCIKVDGKVIKSPTYSPADVEGEIKKQIGE